MKLIQGIGVVVCVLLGIIASELRDLKPATAADYRRALNSSEQTKELSKLSERIALSETAVDFFPLKC